ncbi:ralBP1-associated Eps domain-containing protein 1 isoform X2 [Cotesia glomerata]|uniref:RalBP1-associated Eps domain-containing protein 1 n=1 Tax=Cotesia glomerata TaxID=32391 RepID=A0AAV7J4F2_COTGL|nr:ralBP1-associated Eps domain-containing protein 1 isoform X2 [Cotesia glomerata]KAH0566984.1 hypothetical protein KQX54_005876 [Cotesia glomerata]
MMNWEFISEANAHLTETELRYYGDIFLYCCDNTDPDNVPVVKAAELFRSANLPRDTTIKILDICVGSKVNNHMGRKQFYAALKLVAAHQAGLDIHRDMAINSLEIATPLPRFSWPTSGDEDTTDRRKDCMVAKSTTASGLTGSRLPESTTESESDAESPRETGGSTDSPTPTNSVTQERIIDGLMAGETILDSTSGSWQGLLVSEEQRQLLGTEEESSERHSSDEADGDGDASSFPPEEVWIISDEQRDYYAAQFSRLQPNPEGLLAGSIARTFFEKSRLPVAELRRIWQLADVTRDGALSLQEFYVAMHLVVLRRNHVPLPDSLPPSLAFTLTVPPPPLPTLNSVVVEPSAPQSPPPPPPSPPTQTTQPIHSQSQSQSQTQSQSQSQSQSQGSPSATTGSSAANTREKNKEWTKFVDSPTGSAGALASPGPKPKFIVNFDLQKAAVDRDPKILHPVPLRLTPEAAILASSANGNNSTAGLVDEDILLSAVNLGQRSLNKKSLASNDDGLAVTPKKEPPPPPPPRPYRTHTRSSSLDLNKLGAPPSVPPRVSPGVSSPRKLVGQRSECEDPRLVNENPSFVADFSHFSPKNEDITNLESVPANQSQQFTGVCGAFHIYRKPNLKRGEGEEEGKDDTDDSKSLTLEELREKNAELRLVCEELTRELAGALQERINLRAKLLLIT